jgi:hypothetical protein
LVLRSDALQDEEKDDSFRVCVEQCSLHEQLRTVPLHSQTVCVHIPATDSKLGAPAFVINLCYNMDVPFKLPEVMFQMAKRAGALSSGIPVFSSSFVQSIAPVQVPTTSSTASRGHSFTITLAETSSSTSTGTTAKNTFPTYSIPTSTTSTASSSVVSPTNSSSPETSSNTGLSSSAKIAIGVAIPLVVILLAIAAFWYFRQRHRKNRSPIMENEVHDGGLPEVTTFSDIKKPGQVKYSEAKEGRTPVEAGGVPIAEMGDAARRPSAFELHNQSTTPQLDSRAVLGGVDRGPTNPRTSPVNAPVTRKAVSPPLNPAGTSSSAFPPPWETDPSAMEFHVPRIPLGHPPPQNPLQSPQISLPTAQITQQPSLSTMNATGSGDAELLRQELELARVREREAELLKNIAERRRMGGTGGPA